VAEKIDALKWLEFDQLLFVGSIPTRSTNRTIIKWGVTAPFFLKIKNEENHDY